MRPLRPACGTVSNAQLLTLPETIRISAPGVVTTQLSSLPPASSSATQGAGSAAHHDKINKIKSVHHGYPPRFLLFRSLVIACDKRGAFAQGSKATKQSIGD